MYDTRDFIPNPWRGVYVKLEQRVFPGFFGNKGAFSRTELQVDASIRCGKGGRAYDLYRGVQLRQYAVDDARPDGGLDSGCADITKAVTGISR